MTTDKSHNPGATVTLIVRRTIDASPARLFAAWTEPAHLMRWWGPKGVTCTAAQIDLRVGGEYRLANTFADGGVIWITGVFEVIEPPNQLVYSWRLDAQAGQTERVTVRFQPRGRATEVIVVHERIHDHAARDRHAQGWQGCLDGLDRLMRDG